MISDAIELPTEEMSAAIDDSKLFSSRVSLESSSDLQAPTQAPKISLIYLPYFYMLRQRFARQEVRPEQFPKIESLANFYNQLIKSIQGEFWNKTVSNYPFLDLRGLKQLYVLRREEEVYDFLVKDSFLFPLLLEAYDKISNYFEESSKVFLEVVTDPEAGDEDLLISIHTNLRPEEAFNRLSQLDKEWWLDTPTYVRKKICIDLDFK
ncbi:MAG: hypothetical protein IBX41_01345 [Methanophagales archaeon]|nr:hypothetical protein [Methanophagales archaeon]